MSRKTQNKPGKRNNILINAPAIGKSSMAGVADQIVIVNVSLKNIRALTKSEAILSKKAIMKILAKITAATRKVVTSGIQIDLKAISWRLFVGIISIKIYCA